MLFFQLPSIKFGFAVPPTHLHILAHEPMNGIQKLAHCMPSLYSPAKKRRSLVTVMLKMNLKYTPPENFPVTLVVVLSATLIV